MDLDRPAFERACQFLRNEARPLERALFARAFEGGPPEAIREALAPFANTDGGFGKALEPDLRMPGSSVLATVQGLRVLKEIGAPARDGLVEGALAWLIAARDPAIDAWRSVGPEAEEHPHAFHWQQSIAGGDGWPVGVLPRAEIVSHFHTWPEHVPADLLAAQTAALVASIESAEASVGPDALLFADSFVQNPAAPAAARGAVAKRMLVLGLEMVCRDPEQWGSYVPKPLKLAPRPDSTLAEALAEDVQRNLDWEIEHQDPNGSWGPYWSWSDSFPEAWAAAEREWRGELTLHTLESLRAFGRIAQV